MRGEATEAIEAATRRLFAWLSRESLPLWSTVGIDRDVGGFVEQLTPGGARVADVRRARLVARQIYAFKKAGDLGWTGPVQELVQHGLSALLERHLVENDVIPRFVPAENRCERSFDLYDQAFALFGLAHAFAFTQEKGLETKAIEILRRMREHWRHPGEGF